VTDCPDAVRDRTIEVHREVRQLLDRLDLDPRLVQHIDLWPREARITLFRLNEDGRKYVGEDGDAAVETITKAILA
jgi:hypothetical protein